MVEYMNKLEMAATWVMVLQISLTGQRTFSLGLFNVFHIINDVPVVWQRRASRVLAVMRTGCLCLAV